MKPGQTHDVHDLGRLTTYYYALATLDSAGLESPLSPEVSATPQAA